MTSWSLSSDRRKVSSPKEEVIKVTWELISAEARDTTLKYVVIAKTEKVSKKSAEAASALTTRDDFVAQIEDSQRAGKDAICDELQAGIDSQAKTSGKLRKTIAQLRPKW